MGISIENFENLEQKSELIRVLGHPIRISIAMLLGESKELNVSEIFKKLEIEQAVASHHLRLMKNAGIVDYSKRGKKSYYFLNHSNIKEILDLLMDF